MYEPTLQLSGGLPVYQKKDNRELWLEYFELNWWVRPTYCRGEPAGEAYIATTKPCLPQYCEEGAWFVVMSGVFESAPLVTVWALNIEEYYLPVVVLVRAGIISLFVGRNIIRSIFGHSDVAVNILDSFLFS